MAVGGPLFGNARGGPGGSGSSKALVEFRAGKMSVKGNLVTPDHRKGLVQVEQMDDTLMHFKWKDRTSGVVEDDLIIFPDDIEFVSVPQCTTGRVFVLKFKSSSRRMFFWMQEPKSDKDEELCKKVNDSLNKPATTSSTASGGSSSGVDLSSLADSGLQSLLGNMSKQQLAQLFGAANNLSLDGPGLDVPKAATPKPSSIPAAAESSASTPRVAAASSSSASGVQLTDLQSVLSGIKVPTSKEPPVDLSAGITGDVVRTLLNNPRFVAKMRQLLPSEEQAADGGTSSTQESIDSTIKSPQFKQSLNMFSSGLQSGDLAPLIREFDLGDGAVAAAAEGNLEAFVKAIEATAASKEAVDAKKKPDDDLGGLD